MNFTCNIFCYNNTNCRLHAHNENCIETIKTLAHITPEIALNIHKNSRSTFTDRADNLSRTIDEIL